MSEIKCECKECEKAAQPQGGAEAADSAKVAYDAFAQAVATFTETTSLYQGYPWAWPPCGCYRCPHCGGYPYAPRHPRWEVWC